MSKENMKDIAPTKLRNLSDDVLQSAEEAVKATHDKADQLFDAAEGGVRQLRAEASPVIQDLAARAQDIATRSIDCCAQASVAACIHLPTCSPIQGWLPGLRIETVSPRRLRIMAGSVRVAGQTVALAELTPAEVQRINGAIDFPGRIERERWVEQARRFLAR